MKKHLANIIRAAMFLAVLIICILCATILVRRKDSNYKYADFFDEAKENKIDVLFLGSSHIINAINPVTLYRDYGYTSYNMGGHGSVMQSTYWELIEALDYCKPKWVVVDAYMLEKNYQYLDVMEENASASDVNTSVEQLHLNMDAWPLNRLKIAAVNDLIKDQSIRNQFLFDFIVYHDRWNELNAQDYKTVIGKEDRNGLFGGEMRYDVELAPLSYPNPPAGEMLSERTVGIVYLEKIIDECQRKGIGVVVTYLPFCAEYKDKLAAVSAEEVAVRYGVPYLNMLNAGVIDMSSDLNDTGHLNVTGALKVTDYIGKWLSDNGDLTDHRDDMQYENWNIKVDAFNDEIQSNILSNENIYTKLNMLSLDNVSSIIYFNQGSNALNDEKLMHLVENISGTKTVREAAACDNSPYILIKDVTKGTVREAYGDGKLDQVETMLGHLKYQPVEQNFRFLYPSEDESINYLYDDEYINYDIQIITYNNENGEILSHSYFRSYGDKYVTVQR